MSVITVRIKTILHFKKIFGAENTITLPETSTLQDLLAVMADTWGDEFRRQIFQPGSSMPHNRIRLMVNGRDIAFLNRLQTQLRNDDEILIFPPVAGG